MTVKELLDLLRRAVEEQIVTPDTEVRVWTQPNYPMTYTAGLAVNEGDVTLDGVLYITEEGDQEYGSRDLTDVEDLLA